MKGNVISKILRVAMPKNIESNNKSINKFIKNKFISKNV